MKIGPKYKISRRLGTGVFEKTQTPKYALRVGRKAMKPGRGGKGTKSQFATQLLEKQKARYTYRITEKQFANYAKGAALSKDPKAALYQALEARLDNVVLRAGLLPARGTARQAVSHGHFTVNGRKVTVPSMHLRVGDVVSVREGSKGAGLFREVAARLKETPAPSWLSVNGDKAEVVVKGSPLLEEASLPFDFQAVIEFYSR